LGADGIDFDFVLLSVVFSGFLQMYMLLMHLLVVWTVDVPLLLMHSHKSLDEIHVSWIME